MTNSAAGVRFKRGKVKWIQEEISQSEHHTRQYFASGCIFASISFLRTACWEHFPPCTMKHVFSVAKWSTYSQQSESTELWHNGKHVSTVLQKWSQNIQDSAAVVLRSRPHQRSNKGRSCRSFKILRPSSQCVARETSSNEKLTCVSGSCG